MNRERVREGLADIIQEAIETHEDGLLKREEYLDIADKIIVDEYDDNMNREKVEKIIFDLVHSGEVRYFNSDNIEDEREIARRIADRIIAEEGKDKKKGKKKVEKQLSKFIYPII